MNQFEKDFYGEEIKAVAVGYIRPELDFISLEDLTKAIKDDVSFSEQKCQEEQSQKLKNGEWLK